MAVHPVLKWLGSLLMAVTITHAVQADGTFSPSGQAAWDDNHVVAGLATVAESGDYADLTGVPVLATVATNGDYANLTGTPTSISLSDVYPVGSVYTSTNSGNPAVVFGFGTWNALGSGQMLVGFKTGSSDFGAGGQTGGATGVQAAGTISTPTFTGDSYTPSGTVDLGLYIAKGTNAEAAFTPSGSVSYAASVPQFTGTQVLVTASVNWPAANVSVLSSSHRHELPIIHRANLTVHFLPTSTFGVGSSRVPDARLTATASSIPVMFSDVTNSGAVMMSNTVTAFATAIWPASVPQAVASVSAAGIISWPAGKPTFTGGAGTVPAQVFTGATGSGSAIFTGVGKAPTGTISKPTFTGDTGNNLPPYYTVFFWERVA